MPAVPFIPYADIDRRMNDEIARSNLWPTKPGEHFDIERFLQEFLNCGLDKDGVLEGDVMGEVAFRIGKKTCVNINALLTEAMETNEQSWSLGRFRMTVAHECAHVILHGPIYLSQGKQDGLWDEGTPIVHRCYRSLEQKQFSPADFDREADELNARYGWSSGVLFNDSKARQDMELQANHGGAALLMPLGAWDEAARTLSQNIKSHAPNWSRTAQITEVIKQLAAQFQVSNQAASIRFKFMESSRHLDNLTLELF